MMPGRAHTVSGLGGECGREEEASGARERRRDTYYERNETVEVEDPHPVVRLWGEGMCTGIVPEEVDDERNQLCAVPSQRVENTSERGRTHPDTAEHRAGLDEEREHLERLRAVWVGPELLLDEAAVGPADILSSAPCLSN